MDIEKIFNHFTPESISLSNDDAYYEALFLINNFNKIALNSKDIQGKVNHMFKKMSPDLDLNDIRKAGEFILFKKLWELIKKIDINNESHCVVLKLKSGEKYNHELEYNINLLISYFETSEEYEKCAFLKKIIDKIKEFHT